MKADALTSIGLMCLVAAYLCLSLVVSPNMISSDFVNANIVSINCCQPVFFEQSVCVEYIGVFILLIMDWH
jgi:hypothetical protein